jgi:diaminopimelate epimerase
MTRFFDARGNIYGVAAPAALHRFGLGPSLGAAFAAREHAQWAPAAVQALCAWPAAPPAGAKPHRSDGLLVGPFQAAPPFDLLIVNTDGTLAERSGNGLTIFATALAEDGLAPAAPFALRVHHAGTTPSPSQAEAELAFAEGARGVWLSLGRPEFGAAAVAARPDRVVALADGVAVTVPRLAALDPAWTRSVLVRIGNPHAVTVLADPASLPGMAALRAEPLHGALTRIAYAAGTQGEGDPCPAGINLQWAAPLPDGSLAARVFERGEGPTESSGTSATAVAAAARALGLVAGPRVLVRMPGGTAPLDFAADGSVRLFGVARRQADQPPSSG